MAGETALREARWAREAARSWPAPPAPPHLSDRGVSGADPRFLLAVRRGRGRPGTQGRGQEEEAGP